MGWKKIVAWSVPFVAFLLAALFRRACVTPLRLLFRGGLDPPAARIIWSMEMFLAFLCRCCGARMPARTIYWQADLEMGPAPAAVDEAAAAKPQTSTETAMMSLRLHPDSQPTAIETLVASASSQRPRGDQGEVDAAPKPPRAVANLDSTRYHRVEHSSQGMRIEYIEAPKEYHTYPLRVVTLPPGTILRDDTAQVERAPQASTDNRAGRVGRAGWRGMLQVALRPLTE